MSLQTGKAETTGEHQGRSRRIPDAEYSLYREKIRRLYSDERKSREEIIHLLAEEDGFVLSPKQLKHILQKWALRKNVKSSDKEYIQGHNRHQTMQLLTEPTSYHTFELTTRQGESPLKRRRIHTSSGPSNVPTLDHQLHRVFDNRQPIPEDFSCLATTTKSQGPSPLYQTAFTPGQNFGTPRHATETMSFINPSSSDYCSQASYLTPFVSHAGAMGALASSSDPSNIQSSVHSGSRLATHPDLTVNLLEEHVSGGRACSHGEPSSSLYSECATFSWPMISQSSPRTWLPAISVTDRSSALSRGSSTDVNPATILRLILNLNSACSEFLYDGRQCQTFGFAELCRTLRSRWCQAAMNQVLYRYLHASAELIKHDNAVTMTQDTECTYFAPRSILQEPGSPGVSNKHVRWDQVNVLNNKDGETVIFQLQHLPIRPRRTGNNASASRIRITHVPRTRTRALGISVTLQSSFDSIRYPGLCTGLKTINAIPMNSDVFTCIGRNDLAGLQNLFSLKQASPFDVDPEGISLLWYAMERCSFEIFRLFLDNGVGLDDVGRGHDFYFTMAVRLSISTDTAPQVQCLLNMIGLAQTKGLDGLGSLDTGLFSLVLYRSTRMTADVPVLRDALGYLKNAFDLEFQVDEGVTLLLCASRLLDSILVRALIPNGANTHATDGYGRGALHSALYRHSFVVCPNDCGMSGCEASHDCTCPSELHSHDEHYLAWNPDDTVRMDISQLEPTLLALLDAQCDPNARDNYGLTPSDYARRNDQAWGIWQTALQETGYAYDDESGECYKTYLE